MIRSMTAFARHEQSTPDGEITWEVRSVNHRYLETSLRLEEAFRPLEMQIKKLISSKLGRGKIDASLRYKQPEQSQVSLNIDNNLAQAVIEKYQDLAALSQQSAPIDILRVMQWPGVLQPQQFDQDALNQAVMDALSQAVDELVVMRATEGAALKNMIETRCDQILQIIEDVTARMPEILAQHHQKLTERVEQMVATVDAERLEQELVLLAQKSDVAEELDRLQSHIKEVKQVLQKDEPVGRRLDFLMQELNREANTLSSKSINSDTTKQSVELKVLIEQMREQIQNIE